MEDIAQDSKQEGQVLMPAGESLLTLGSGF
jgi:hypothetical protein